MSEHGRADNWDYWRGLSKEIQFVCVLQNGPAGVRTMGWEKGSSGRQAIRRLEESGDCEEQRAPREEKSERDRAEASSHSVT